MYLNNANFYAHIAARFPATMSDVCIRTAQGDCYSWDDVNHASAKIANLLLNLQLPAGARIAVQVEHSPEALLLQLAILRAGLVLMPLDISIQAVEMRAIIAHHQPAVVVCCPKNFGWLGQLAFQLGSTHVFTLGNGMPNHGSLLLRATPLSSQLSTVVTAPDALAYIDENGQQFSHVELCADLDATLVRFQHQTGYTLALA